MQNNVTELTQRLLKSLDSNYNVIDMPTVIEVLSLLERLAITKELLETTRLGKHVNELRRRTSDESLSRRAKELVKKWRLMVLPDSNGQQSAAVKPTSQHDGGGGGGGKKRGAVPLTADNHTHATKRQRLNGAASELDFSDNSNSSFGVDVFIPKQSAQPPIVVNSDSNSSLPDKHDGHQHHHHDEPKKRGRKKGSKNHRNLLDEAESSFTNKLAVSRGNSKVKTTQELVASLQNKAAAPPAPQQTNAAAKLKEDLNERAAKLTERVSIIDQKLNTNASRYKNNQRGKHTPSRPDSSLGIGGKVIESGSVINDRHHLHHNQNSRNDDDDAIIVVDDMPPESAPESRDGSVVGSADGEKETEVKREAESDAPRSLTVEECRALMPPIQPYDQDDEDDATASTPICTCLLKENKPDFTLDEEDDVNTEHTFEFVEDHECVARDHLRLKYRLGEPDDGRVADLHGRPWAGVNGIRSLGEDKETGRPDERGLYANVVPDHNAERLPRWRTPSENHEKYCISHGDDRTTRSDGDGGCAEGALRTDSGLGAFREWYETADVPSYGGEPLRILPYVIID